VSKVVLGRNGFAGGRIACSRFCGERGEELAFVGCCRPALDFVGCHGPALGHRWLSSAHLYTDFVNKKKKRKKENIPGAQDATRPEPPLLLLGCVGFRGLL